MTERCKAIPDFADESEERGFWEANDSTDYLDWSNAGPSCARVWPFPGSEVMVIL
jgi:hypothetical protein